MPHPLRKPLLLALAFSLAAGPALAGGAPLLEDGFDHGDLTAWSLADGEPVATCAAGSPPADSLAGDLGPAPTGPFHELGCLEVTNDRPFARRETAFSGIPLPRELALTTTDGLALVGPGDRRVAAQFDVLSRWGGTAGDTSRPIRWLEVSLSSEPAAGSTQVYSLRRYLAPSAPADPFAATVAAQGGDLVVDTGLATFILDPQSPALFAAISIDLDDDGAGRTVVYAHSPGAGPRLVFDPGGGSVVLDTSTPGLVSVDAGGFEVVESGPVKAVVSLRGHFTAPGGAGRCTRDGLDYERFGYTLIASFHRGRRDVGLQFHVRNECSDALGGSWTDDAVTIDSAAWVLPFGFASPTLFHAGGGAVASIPSFTGSARVEQRKGAGDPWLRRARVVVGGGTLESGEAFAEPFLGVGDGQVTAGLQLGWMRFREPQALAAEGSTLVLEVIGEPLVVGEGKGIWNTALLHLEQTPGGPAPGQLEALRRAGAAELERGLLSRLRRHGVNAAGILPSLGTGAASAIKTAYLETLETLHEETVLPGGQWHRAKTFGSQLWPDVQTDPFAIDLASPLVNSGAMNYWNASGAELLELLRSGEPRWAWDFALPQSWLQTFSAYLNLGEQGHGNRNGVAVTSGGSGEGHWHRSAFGSDDYTYDAGLHLAYALRPHVGMRHRFAQAGRTIVDRYSIPVGQQGTRDPFVNAVEVGRGQVQHFEMLANCAEFVPGARGQACHDRLLELLSELATENLRFGVFCAEDVPSASTCGLPQQFMTNAMHYAFFHRLWRNYGELDPFVGGRLETALAEAPLHFYQEGIAKLGDGVTIDVEADWAALLECALTGGGSQLGACSWVATSDGPAMLRPNKPHTLALLLVAHEVDPSVGLCQPARAALEEPSLLAMWNETMFNQAGWLKATAQMMQGAVFAVGGYDVCGGP